MKKFSSFVIVSTMLVGSVTSAPPGNALPGQSLENYDIRGDTTKEGAATLAAYRAKTNTQGLTAARQLLITGRSDLLSSIPNLRVEDNPFGTAPEIVDVTGATAALTESSNEAH
jgi:hypothetical protein